MTPDNRHPSDAPSPENLRSPGQGESSPDDTLISAPPDVPRSHQDPVAGGPHTDDPMSPPPDDDAGIDDPGVDARDESLVEEVLRRRRAERARDALVAPWSTGRARRLRLILLVLIVVGPVLGSLFALVLIPAGTGNEASAVPDEPAALAVKATVRNVDAIAGEATVRLVPSAPTDGAGELFDNGVLTEEVSLGVNDAAGENVRVLPAGRPPGALIVTVPLTGSRVTRYPLDTYEAVILVQARLGDSDEDTVPVALTVSTDDPLFAISAEEVTASSSAATVTLQVERRATVIGWAVFFIVLCWMLAIAAASIAWVTVVRGIPAPAWSWAFLIGILFALPPLRTSLPGSPPGGSLVDFAAFYWAVGIVAFTLVGLALSWNVRIRRWPDSPDAPRPPA